MTGLRNGKSWLIGIFLLAALLVPVFIQDVYLRHLFIISFVYGIVAASWDLTLGFAGIFNFAHIAFFGVGVYATGLTAKLLGVDPWLAMLIGGFAASAAAAIIALPVVRLQGVYVVLVTFAFSQLVMQLVISQSDVTGGTQGLVRVPTISLPHYNFLRDYKFGYYYVALALLVTTTALLRWLVRSDFGLSIRALRDNEDYGVSRGIPIARQRLKALVASAFFTGIAGGFYVIYLRVASPEVFDFSTVSLILSMVLVGGTSSIYGPVFAALILTFISEGLANIDNFSEGRHMLVAVVMIIVLLFLPKGLASALPSGFGEKAFFLRRKQNEVRRAGDTERNKNAIGQSLTSLDGLSRDHPISGRVLNRE
ncbi:branched-chain amino acid ABC transporter permease [Bradyrhizobium ottawaense]|uniref:branched-chain amino acid ABC transporter permease n=1 Tax=Bradyrhizobium ottawaense TaxID=931866 RepID=UPI000BEA1FB2|nr:branched-chain amino acid ABC transporter permease [Bradyrhizobium ottawaense]PDT64353.1 branched-chain amino acid ABC transporter permease [Bradyrhizobium ottawaense]